MSHDHPHPHPHPHPSGPPPMAISSNPAMTALLDSLPTSSLPFALTEVALPPGAAPPQQPGAPAPTQQLITCAIHKQVVCEPCGVNYAALNYMHQFMRGAPPEAIPPPPNVQAPPQRAEMIKNAKEAGNAAFKQNNFPVAVQHYSRSADMALSRPPWEPSALSKDESTIALCNRSAAFALAGAWTAALADAEAVVVLKRPWTRGHYRKSRALVGLGRLEEARQAAIDGLQFEPNDKDLNAVLKEMDQKLAEE